MRVGLTPADGAYLNNGRGLRSGALEAMRRVLGCQPGDLPEWVEAAD